MTLEKYSLIMILLAEPQVAYMGFYKSGKGALSLRESISLCKYIVIRIDLVGPFTAIFG